jgi:hypothetical protein
MSPEVASQRYYSFTRQSRVVISHRVTRHADFHASNTTMQPHEPGNIQSKIPQDSTQAPIATDIDMSESTMTEVEDPPNGDLAVGYADGKSRIGIKQRLKHFTFAWFLSTMSTGGLAVALAETPHKFRGTWSPTSPQRYLMANSISRTLHHRPDSFHL